MNETDLAQGPRLPGTRAVSGSAETFDVTYIQVRLEGFGTHTRRHAAGRMDTHPFFSREAMHAALWDYWSPRAPHEPTPAVIPYGSTPLWSDEPATRDLHYAGPTGHRIAKDRRPAALSIGVQEAMVPGTLLQAAFWGERSNFPPRLEVGRTFDIGKGRSPCRIVAMEEASRVPLVAGRVGHHSLPIQVGNSELRDGGLPGLAFRVLARSPWYVVLRLAPGCDVPVLRIAGLGVPCLPEEKAA